MPAVLEFVALGAVDLAILLVGASWLVGSHQGPASGTPDNLLAGVTCLGLLGSAGVIGYLDGKHSIALTLYVMGDRCARAEEGRKYPGEDAGAETDSTDEDVAAPANKGQRRNSKRKGKTVLAVEGSGEPGAAKKVKADDPGKEVADASPTYL